MLDVFSLTFTLAAFWFYLKERYVLSGWMLALSALAKLNGALAILVIGLHWFLNGRKHQWRFLFSMLSAPVLFLALMPVCDYIILGEWLNPIEQVMEMMDITRQITFASYEPGGIATRPWMWLLAPLIINYWYDPHYIGMISPTVWVFIMPLVLYIIWRAIKGNNAFIFLFSWFLGLYMIWIPASLLTDRASYLFYFYPTIGAICIGLAIVVFKLLNIARARRRGKLRHFLIIGVLLYTLFHIIAFIRLAPVSLWWSIPLGIILYILTIRYTGIFNWYRPWIRTATAENQVDMPPQQE
jgi:predicted membrane-bound dolichyl-phosphate-mannose-protein mannosyltransferase